MWLSDTIIAYSKYVGFGIVVVVQVEKQRMEAWRVFLRAHSAVVRNLEQELLAERDLPLTWYDVLVQLSEGGGSLRMHELADRLLLSRSATTRFVERLEQRQLIERRSCPEDRRGTYVVLTEVGRDTLREAAPVHLRGIGEHFASRLSKEDARALIETLSKVLS